MPFFLKLREKAYWERCQLSRFQIDRKIPVPECRHEDQLSDPSCLVIMSVCNVVANVESF